MLHEIDVQTFYKTREPIKSGDEYTEVAIEEIETGFELRVTRGFYGRPAPELRTAQTFASKDRAVRDFAAQCQKAQAQGFFPYLLPIHGAGDAQ